MTGKDVVATAILAKTADDDKNYYRIEAIDEASGDVTLQQYGGDLTEALTSETVTASDILGQYRVVSQPNPEKEGESDTGAESENQLPVVPPPAVPKDPDKGNDAVKEPVVERKKVDPEAKTEIDFNRAIDLDSKIGIDTTLTDQKDQEYTVEGVRADGTIFLKENSDGKQKTIQYDPENVYRDFILNSSKFEGKPQFPLVRRIISENKAYEKDNSLKIPETSITKTGGYLQAYYEANKEIIDQKTGTKVGDRYVADVTESDFIQFERVSEAQVICGFASKDNRYPRIVFDVSNNFDPQVDVYNLPNNKIARDGDSGSIEDKSSSEEGSGDKPKVLREETLPPTMEINEREEKLLDILNSGQGNSVEVITQDPELKLIVTGVNPYSGGAYIKKNDGTTELRSMDAIHLSIMDAVAFKQLAK